MRLKVTLELHLNQRGEALVLASGFWLLAFCPSRKTWNGEDGNNRLRQGVILAYLLIFARRLALKTKCSIITLVRPSRCRAGGGSSLHRITSRLPAGSMASVGVDDLRATAARLHQLSCTSSGGFTQVDAVDTSGALQSAPGPRGPCGAVATLARTLPG